MVATGAAAFGIGSDSGGSLRFPAHCCGLVGLRASYGRVPVTGHFPRVATLGDGRTVIGPLTRRVDDARFVLPILAGPDGRDPSCPPVPATRESPVAGLRIGVHRQTLDGAPLRGDVVAALDVAVDALAAAGCLLADDDVLDVAHALDITRRYWGRTRLPTGEVEQLLHDWDRSRLRAMRLLDRYDAILSPAAPYPAPLLGAADDANWTYALSASLWGWPALVVPAGRSVEGLPLGVQLVAGPWCEGTCLALGEIVERAAPAARRG
jgi:amidase